MDQRDAVRDGRVARFWGRYLAVLKLFRVPEKAQPWYRRHVQGFVDHRPDVRLAARKPADLEEWFGALGRNPQLEEWKYRQQVDALRLLYTQFLKADWARDFDWDRWATHGMALGRDHPTIARTYEAIDKAVENPKNQFARTWPALYRKFLAAIRIPGYSVNTEQSYLGWTNRFLKFHGGVPPDRCSEAEVASFLEYLAVQLKVAGATQGQALNALVFFFARVLEKPLGDIGPFKRPTRPRRVPTVLSVREKEVLLSRLNVLNRGGRVVQSPLDSLGGRVPPETGVRETALAYTWDAGGGNARRPGRVSYLPRWTGV